MSLWVLGGTGTLGRCVRERLQRAGVAHQAPSHAELPLEQAEAIRAWGAKHRPQLVLNCTAYNAVDKAETEVDAARAINSVAPGLLAEVAAQSGGRLVHVSTDYVFDGELRRPYREDDPVAPLGAYGRSKLDGERAVLAALGDAGRAWVVRVSWLFGPAGKDFVGRMAGRLRKGESVRVVNDQHGRPTYAPDLAAALLRLCGVEGGPACAAGLYHYASAGETTWYDLTVAIAETLGVPLDRVAPVPASAFPTPARRPKYSVLSTARIEAATGLHPRSWRDGVRESLADPRS